ncbi:ABC transporter ATP-binding protein [Caldisericum exile]|uniref:Oligopeptide ABC transporter ATP-binding protein n=1 Tax=Caldisericum exile (strain DSM 21853 / NBRC 104410 / AZM16c01) TaxID=511051 RepID=A0A7U6GF66_CALEA|nr:dipeptide ABC transporter ATP-binding protein [Caldisericum exile]BAL81293.1 oligopeptide ABC transporter ATP-binding protein [Caldisericum exile AZM16c01]
MKKLVEVQNLVKYFPVLGGVFSRPVGWVKAVDDVSFHIFEGETFGLVGESGSGKTTAGKTIIRLIEPTKGKIIFDGKDITKLPENQLRPIRREMQIIFQDPYGSLNPRMPIGEIIREPLLVHGIGDRKEQEERVVEIMKLVGLRPEYLRRYPHEFSGGQRQRIGIARAIVLNPKFVVADEPVSALDASIQAQVLNLLLELQQKLALTYLLVAHNLAVVRHVSDRIGVMYLGKLVEVAETKELFTTPLHPYTQALLSAIPIPDPEIKKERILLQGDIPSPINPPSGCRFRTRCRFAKDICAEKEPPLIDVGSGHYVACHFVKEGKVVEYSK